MHEYKNIPNAHTRCDKRYSPNNSPINNNKAKEQLKSRKLPDAQSRQANLQAEHDRFEKLGPRYKKASLRKQRALKRKISIEVEQADKKNITKISFNILLLLGNILNFARNLQQKSLLSARENKVAKNKAPSKEKSLISVAANPQLMLRHQNTTIAYDMHKNWELFSTRGPHLHDIRQGQAGDCYFLAALAIVANKSQEFITDMITLNDDDSVSVKFYNQNPDGSYQPVYIRIDEKIPMSLKKEVYARSHDSDNNQRPEVWVPLVEKAFAQFAESYEGLSRSSGQGYQAIGEGGFINEALAIITGQQGHRAVVSRLSDEALLEIINNSQYVAAGSGAGNNTVPGGHAYSIQGVRHDGENLRIELRNPWGRMGGDTTYNNQGVFELSLKEFRTLFFGVYFVRGLALAM